MLCLHIANGCEPCLVVTMLVISPFENTNTNSSCDSEFHIHGVICMIVRHKENVLGSATNSDFYVSY